MANQKGAPPRDKDEILSKHKNENRFGDEREKTIRTRRDAFSLWGVLGLGVVFMGLKIWQGQSPADLVSLFFCMSGLAFVYEGVQLRQKRCLIPGVVLLALAAWFFYEFCRALLA